MPLRPLDLALLRDVVKWAEEQGGHKLSVGHSRFMNITGDGQIEEANTVVDESARAIEKRIQTYWNTGDKFELVFVLCFVKESMAQCSMPPEMKLQFPREHEQENR